MRPILATSTKMNLTSSEAGAWLRTVRSLVADLAGTDLVVLPPFTSLWVARDVLAGSNVAWGAQEMHAEDAGAHTGDVSAPMLVDLGCTWVELGHVERRRDYGESDERVAAKVAQALRFGLTPIVCVGELRREDAAGAAETVPAEVARCLASVPGDRRDRVVIAYEPAWAIGAGAVAAEPRHVLAVHEAIHRWLRSPEGGGVAGRVIYGGSVDEAAAGSLLDSGGIDGLFVGRAALDPRVFGRLARLVDPAASQRG